MDAFLIGVLLLLGIGETFALGERLTTTQKTQLSVGAFDAAVGLAVGYCVGRFKLQGSGLGCFQLESQSEQQILSPESGLALIEQTLATLTTLREWLFDAKPKLGHRIQNDLDLSVSSRCSNG